MRFKGTVTALVASAALLVAGAAGAGVNESLLSGHYDAVDKKEPLFNQAETEVLVLNQNDVEIQGICTDLILASVEIDFGTDAVDQSSITEKKAKIEQKNKFNPAEVFATIAGTCEVGGGLCFDDGMCDVPNAEACLGVIGDVLICEKVTLKSDVKTKSGVADTMKWKAEAKNCAAGPLEGFTLEALCKNQKSISVSAKPEDLKIKKIKISGNGDATILVP
jgi:hypothetical protein